jgi:hypothetical protein
LLIVWADAQNEFPVLNNNVQTFCAPSLLGERKREATTSLTELFAQHENDDGLIYNVQLLLDDD